MEVKQINQLMVSMGKTGIKRLVLKKQGVELELEREEKAPHISLQQALSDVTGENPMRDDFERHRHLGVMAQAQEEEEKQEEEEECLYVTSPMVGTLYTRPSPTEPLFVNPGDTIDENDVVCIVEAMKVMNEVKAGVSGVIKEVLIEDGHPVEYGTKLFKIIPKG